MSRRALSHRKSTEASAAYLKKAYEEIRFVDTGAAAYNAGAAMISRQMDLQKETELLQSPVGRGNGTLCIPDSGPETDYESSRTVQF